MENTLKTGSASLPRGPSCFILSAPPETNAQQQIQSTYHDDSCGQDRISYYLICVWLLSLVDDARYSWHSLVLLRAVLVVILLHPC